MPASDRAFRVNEQPYDERFSDCLTNHVSLEDRVRGRHRGLIQVVYDVHRESSHKTLVVMFKHVFGRQQITKTYSHRCWIWTFTAEEATIWALVSSAGVRWEFDYRTDPAQGWLIPEAVVRTIREREQEVERHKQQRAVESPNRRSSR